MKEELQEDSDGGDKIDEQLEGTWSDTCSSTASHRLQSVASRRVLEGLRFGQKNDSAREWEEADDSVNDDSECEHRIGVNSSAGRNDGERVHSEPIEVVEVMAMYESYRHIRKKNNEAARRYRSNQKRQQTVLQEECSRLERVLPYKRQHAKELERKVAVLKKVVNSKLFENTGKE